MNGMGEEFENLTGESQEGTIRPVALFDWELRDIDQKTERLKLFYKNIYLSGQFMLLDYPERNY